MSITKLTTNGLTGTKYDTVSADNYYMEPIATTLVGAGGVATVTFSDIPQVYKHLQVRIFSRSTTSTYQQSGGYVRFNGDTGNNYTRHGLYGDGATAGATTAATSTSYIDTNQEASNLNSTNTFGVAVVDILDYSNVYKFKTVRSLTGSDINGAGTMLLRSGLWMNTAAITSMVFTESNSNFAQYSRFSLFGLKA